MKRRQFLAASAVALAGVRFPQSPPQAAPGVMPKLTRFITTLQLDTIPPKALQTAREAIFDSLGVAIAGSREESAVIASKLVREERAKEEASVYGARFRSSTPQAAFLNGIAEHAHDFDHSFVAGGQPTSPVIPAVFALGESLGARGKQVLEAYVAGFEVAAALVLSVQNSGAAGWHANGTMGAFGATAACAKLLGLKPSEVDMALAMTASMTSGVTSNFGTMTKPLHVGQAARNGVLAARLAQSGFTANPQTLEAQNGFFATYYQSGRPDFTAFDELGRTFALEKYGVRFKPYPCGGLTHTAIYAAIQMRNDLHITPENVEHIDVDVPRDTAAPLTFRVPKNGLEGKFSMPYLMARALIDGNLTLETFTDAAVRNPRVLALLDRVEMKVDPRLQSGSDGSRPATVSIRLKSGETKTRQEKFPKGSPQVPMVREELTAKFRSCAHGIISEGSVERLQGLVEKLETLPNVRTLTALLGG